VAELEARRYLIDPFGEFPEIPDQVVAAWKAPFGPHESWELTVTDAQVSGPHGLVGIRLYTPTGPAPVGGRACLIWMHGGAFAWGNLEMPEAHEVARGIAGRADAVVVSVDYRLCPVPPELGGSTAGRVDGRGQPVRFPVPQDDCAAVLAAVAGDPGRFGIDPARIAVGGASAGASLAASVALRAARSGRPPWQALLVYPMLHRELPAPDEELSAALDAVPAALQFPNWMLAAVQRTTCGADSRQPEADAYPALSDDLDLFPAAYVENCEFDAFRSSGRRFCEQLRARGVDVVEATRRGVPHGHLDLVGFTPAHETLDALAARLGRAAHPGVDTEIEPDERCRCDHPPRCYHRI
jgi:xylan 1,4-beta-xylosidase